MVATLAKMAVPTYYIESQAAHEGHEGEDPGDPEAEGGYYTGGGKERPGEWYNPAGLFRLKDGGLVRDKTFYALAGGFSPDGTSLVRNAGSERRSPGFDLTFSADKSISALWALSPADEREATRARRHRCRAACPRRHDLPALRHDTRRRGRPSCRARRHAGGDVPAPHLARRRPAAACPCDDLQPGEDACRRRVPRAPRLSALLVEDGGRRGVPQPSGLSDAPAPRDRDGTPRAGRAIYARCRHGPGAGTGLEQAAQGDRRDRRRLSRRRGTHQSGPDGSGNPGDTPAQG